MRADGFEVMDIRISRARGAGYDVEVRLGEREFPGGTIAEGVADAVSTATPEEQGARLFAAFVADDRVRSAWTVAAALASRRRIRLRIDDDAPELHALPWEALFDDMPEATAQLPAADRDTPFSRVAVASRELLPAIVERPVHVLTAVAAPSGLETFRLPALARAEEEALIIEAMAVAPAGLVRHTALSGACSLTRLEAALEGGVHVLHLMAHGVMRGDGEVSLLLEGTGGAVERVDGASFAAMCERLERSLRLIVLMVCSSARRSPEDVGAGLVPKLLAAGVPAVLAMQDLMPLRTARAFTRTFYEELWRTGEVDRAANRARATTQTGRLSGTVVPVLYSGLVGGRVFDPSVVAKTGVKSGRFGAWTELGGSARQISAVRGKDGCIEVFAVDGAGALTGCRQAAPGGSFGAWEAVDGGIREALAVVDQRGRVALFVIDAKGACRQRLRTAPGVWGAWALLGGPATRMTAACGAAGTLAMFVVDNDGELQFAGQEAEAGAWDGWYGDWEFDDEKYRQILAVRDGQGLVKIFTLHEDLTLWSAQQDAEGEFSERERFAKQVHGFFATVRGGRVQVLAVDEDGGVRRCEQKTAGGPWSGWERLGGACSEVVAVGRAGGLEVFGVGADGRLASAAEQDEGWGAWTPIAGPRLAQLVALEDGKGGVALIGLDRDGKVQCCVGR